MKNPLSILLFLYFSLCIGCGTVGTRYDFLPTATRQQKKKIISVVDATVNRMEFTTDTDSIKRARNEGDTFFRRYVKGSIVLVMTAYQAGPCVYLYRAGSFRTATFTATEELLTVGLRHIDPHVVIISGYAPNPMM